MTDLLDRACNAAINSNQRQEPIDIADFDTGPRESWRRDIAAALSVMADDIRENYTRIQREEFGRGISADRLDAIIDRYVGGSRE